MAKLEDHVAVPGAIVGLVWIGVDYRVDRRLIAAGVILVGLVSNAFIWLLNAVGYLVSFVAIRRSYSKDVLTYRGLTVAVIIGIIIGYILGKVF